MADTKNNIDGEALYLKVNELAEEHPKYFAEVCLSLGICYPGKESLMNTLSCIFQLQTAIGGATDAMVEALLNYGVIKQDEQPINVTEHKPLGKNIYLPKPTKSEIDGAYI